MLAAPLGPDTEVVGRAQRDHVWRIIALFTPSLLLNFVAGNFLASTVEQDAILIFGDDSFLRRSHLQQWQLNITGFSILSDEDYGSAFTTELSPSCRVE